MTDVDIDIAIEEPEFEGPPDPDEEGTPEPDDAAEEGTTPPEEPA